MDALDGLENREAKTGRDPASHRPTFLMYLQVDGFEWKYLLNEFFTMTSFP